MCTLPFHLDFFLKKCYFLIMSDTSKVKKITEITPAFLVWFTLIALIILSIAFPLWAIYFVIVFDVYWITRLFYMMVWLMISWFKYRRADKINWLKRVKSLPKNYLDYFHVITYPTYKEPYEVIERSLEKLLATDYPKEKFIVVLGGEERDRENFTAIAEKVKNKFADKFFKLLLTVHPPAPDELPGKGSNVHFMEARLKEFIDNELKVPYENIIVSCFDIETLPHPQYFACLAYHYLTRANPARASYQPLILYNNNIWESNPIVRVVASATTFWLLTDLSRPEKLFTFSSHSMSFKMLVDVGFHDKTIVTEDSRIALQGLTRYNGDYEVVPLFITLSMDTVYIGKFWKSLADQYKQMRRWAWGVEHFPWLLAKFFGKNAVKMPLLKKLRYLWYQTEGMYSWATAPLIILIMGRLPLWLASDEARATALFQNAPRTLETLMTIGMFGLIINAVMYTFMLPDRPKGYGLGNYVIMVLQWILFPFTMVIFGSVPAIEAQTRLALGGKYRLGFWVTEKNLVTGNK